MILDINTWTGHWNTHPIRGDVESVRAALTACGVDRICLSPLDAAWCPNQHQHNGMVYDAMRRYPEIIPVPVLDPTLSTWPEELACALIQPRMRLVKLLPAYGPYELSAADALCEALAQENLAVIIQTRIDDPRAQHPLVRASDIPADAIVDLAERHPHLTVIIGGPTTASIRSLGDRLLALPNLYADVSQAEGLDGIKTLVDAGLTHKLLFGSHAPLFVPFSALVRVLNDLNDEDAAAILGGNAVRMLGRF